MNKRSKGPMAAAVVAVGVLVVLFVLPEEDAATGRRERRVDAPTDSDSIARRGGGEAAEVDATQGASAGSSLAISVRALSGDHPVSGAHIEVLHNGRVVVRGTTDEGGRFAAHAIPDGVLQVVAAASGFSQSEARVHHGRTKQPTVVSILLAGGHAVRGRVLDDEGNPVVGATVETVSGVKFQGATVSSQSVTTDAAGGFEFLALPAGEQLFSARWPRGWGGPGVRIRVPIAGTIDLQLTRGAMIEGTITGASSGRGLAGVTVRVSDINYSSRASARTDENGNYTLGPFDPRRPPVYLTAARPGYRPASQDDLATRGLAAPHPYIDGRTILDLALGAGDRVRIDFALDKGAVVVGTVRGPDGPIANAVVRAIPPHGAPWTRTNTEGQYRLVGLAARPILVAVQAPGYLQSGAIFPLSPSGVELSEAFPLMGVRPTFGSETRLDVQMRRGRVVHAVVLDTADNPLPDATLWARPSVGPSQPAVHPRGDGTHTISGVAAGGQLLIGARLDGYEGVEPRGTRVAEGAGDVLTIVRLRKRVTLTVRGTVVSRGEPKLQGAYVQVVWVDRSGFPLDPVGRMKLWAQALRHPVGSDGSFSVRLDGAPGRFAVRASALGHVAAYSSDQVVTIDTAEAEVDLQLAAGTGLRGVVWDAVTARAVEGAAIRLTSADANTRNAAMWYVTPTATDAAGAFAVFDLSRGTYLLEVHTRGYLALRQTVKVNDRTAPLTLRLTPADGEIEGVVEDEQGVGFVGARIHAVQGDTVSRSVRSRVDGSFTLAGLMRLRANVEAGATGHLDSSAVGVPVGTRDLRLVLELGVVAAGVVRDQQGSPLPNTWIRFAPSDRSEAGTWVQTDHLGRFRTVGLGAGKHQISLRVRGKRVLIGNAVLPDENIELRR